MEWFQLLIVPEILCWSLRAACQAAFRYSGLSTNFFKSKQLKMARLFRLRLLMSAAGMFLWQEKYQDDIELAIRYVF
jgi:hypothetical protein